MVCKVKMKQCRKVNFIQHSLSRAVTKQERETGILFHILLFLKKFEVFKFQNDIIISSLLKCVELRIVLSVINLLW